MLKLHNAFCARDKRFQDFWVGDTFPGISVQQKPSAKALDQGLNLYPIIAGSVDSDK